MQGKGGCRTEASFKPNLDRAEVRPSCGTEFRNEIPTHALKARASYPCPRVECLRAGEAVARPGGRFRPLQANMEEVSLPEREQPTGTGSVFREPAYVRFWFARICSTISFQVAAVAVGWQVYALTHSTFALGMVGLVQFLPMLLLTLVVGHVADRFNRKTIISICQVVEGVDPGAAGGEQLSSPVAPVRHLLCGCGHRGRAGLREPVDPGPGP